MKFELLIIGITAFFIFNTYYDGKYTKMIIKNKKYIQIGFFVILGIGFYLLVKKNPLKCKNILMNANNVIKYMPIDKTSMDMISPILDFTTSSNSSSFMSGLNNDDDIDNSPNTYEKRILQSGTKATKRSVSETKKKYVASMQNWKCGECKKQLNAWFEVDHKVRLEYGGGNEVANLLALCRECHGHKTAMENM